jgi:hypothetical protein
MTNFCAPTISEARRMDRASWPAVSNQIPPSESLGRRSSDRALPMGVEAVEHERQRATEVGHDPADTREAFEEARAVQPNHGDRVVEDGAEIPQHVVVVEHALGTETVRMQEDGESERVDRIVDRLPPRVVDGHTLHV